MPKVIKTPHAAIKVWNYTDRINDTGSTGNANEVGEEIISTVSCIAIQTAKSKGDPVGTFSLVLAPTRNWVAVLTPGSWCAIMMSNNPITKNAWTKADPSLIKMIGRIDTVRVDVSVGDDGARQTRYLVSGRDWGSIFNNILYIDPLIADPNSQTGQQGNALYVEIIKYLLNDKNTPEQVKIAQNLQMILSVFGKPLSVPDSQRLAKSTHTIAFPSAMANFFQFEDALGGKAIQTDISKLIKLQSGSLITTEGVYETDVRDGQGWINPFSLVGTHTAWSILMDNSNHALNELYPELRWVNNSPQLTLYNRIKPFSFQANAVPNIDTQLRSKFQNVVTHKLEDDLVISVNAGTNWADKFNFIEIKPDMTEMYVLENVTKEKSQAYQKGNTDVFDREGFRPLIFSVKQIPIQLGEKDADELLQDLLQKWVNLLQEWYFDSHRLLNGRLVMTGSTDYIPVGDNIMFDAGLLGLTQNYNSGAVNKNSKIYVLAHVESIQHNLTVGENGARQYQTIIQFVRGIIVDESKSLIGEGTIDTLATALSLPDSINHQTIVASATADDPEKDA